MYKTVRFRIFKKRLSRSPATDVMLFLFILIVAMFMVLPMVYAISSSLKPPNELWIFPPRFFVRNPTLKNYTDLFALMSGSWIPFSRYVLNSLIITVCGTVGLVVVASLCAYPLSRYRFPGTKLFFSMVVTALMFSTAVTAIPNYIIMSKIGLIDTYWSVIIPAFGMPLGLFLMKQFMDQNVPMTILEAADIDGAGEGIKFFKIVMPMVKPAWLTLIIFSVQSLWGIGNSSYIYSEQLKTMTYAFSQIQAAGIARAGVGAAIAVIMMSLPLAVFIITQSSIIETMTTSGIKE